MVTPPPNLPPEAMPYARWVTESINGLQRRVDIGDTETHNLLKQLNTSITNLNNQFYALPTPIGAYKSNTNFGLATAQVVTLTLVVPNNKTRVALSVIGNVGVLDKTSGGVAIARAVINVAATSSIMGALSSSSPTIPAAKDAGASVVQNIITPAYGFTADTLTPGSNITITMTITASNTAAYGVDATNYGTITVTGAFYN